MNPMGLPTQPCPGCGRPVLEFGFSTGVEVWEPPGEDPALAPNGNHRHTPERCQAQRVIV